MNIGHCCEAPKEMVRGSATSCARESERAASVEVRLEPAAAGWGELISRAWAGRKAGRAEQFRRELGLPTDEPIVMSGHQAEFWHAGILAKRLAGAKASERFGASAVWLVPDQDAFDGERLAYPAQTPKGLVRRELSVAQSDAGHGDKAAGRLPAMVVREGACVDDAATESAREGAASVIAALRKNEGEATAARQVSGALDDLLERFVEPAPTLFATELHKTTLFRELVEMMRRDPGRAARSFNEAVTEVGGAGVGALAMSDDVDLIELPLWRLGADGTRRRVFAGELGGLKIEKLAPRAMLLTGIVRLAGCELFIHGTGGAAYDEATERWFALWLGERLAPAALVTATVRMDLPGGDVTEEDFARAKWRAHHARHHPGMIGSTELEGERARLVREIDAAARGSEARAQLYGQAQELLTQYRRERAGELGELEAEVGKVEKKLASRDVAGSRTWAFALLGEEKLRALQAAIDGAIVMKRT